MPSIVEWGFCGILVLRCRSQSTIRWSWSVRATVGPFKGLGGGSLLTDGELLTLMRDKESDRVERKASLSDSDKIRQAICAFTNDLPNHGLPGVIFIGIKDDGSNANLTVTDDLLLNLAHMRSDGQIQPFPTLSVQKKTLDGCEVVVVEVQPSYNPPVRYNGRVWIRVGPRRALATPEEERRLTEKRRAGDLSFDQQAISGATVADLDTDLFQRLYLPNAVAPEVLAENHRPLEQQLASLRFLTKNGIPNVAAVLLFAKDPLRWLPGAYVQFLRLDGPELTDPIRHQKDISGPLPDLLRQLDDVLMANTSVSSNVRLSIEQKRPDYPLVALQQFSRNAVMHRVYEGTNAPARIYWFSDRIEIFSPGGLYGQVNESNFGKGATDYRNPLIAEAMKTLGFVQRFGMGIPLARKELEKNGNPPPEFHFEPTDVLVTIRRD